MAHYIAQKISEVETSIGEDKKGAEEKCFETILKLWKHRAYYDMGNKPLENFDPIFKTLNRLNPDNKEPFYFQPEYSTRNKSDHKDDCIKQFLTMATQIDEIVRVWLEYIFQYAAGQAKDEKTKEWLEAAAPLADKDEALLIIRKLSEHNTDENGIDSGSIILKSRIEQLKRYREFNEELICMYEEKIKQS
jgi:hypothetical protein